MISLKTKDWSIENIETIFFDKDGTFIDLHYFWGKMTQMRCQEIIKRFNLSDKIIDKLCDYLGYDLKNKKMKSDGITALYSRSKIIEIFRGKLLEIGVGVTEIELAQIFDDVSLVFYKEIEKYTKPINDAIKFIKKIREKGVKTAIITSDSVDSAKITIKNFGWDDLFDIVLGRESSGETKESGALTKIALEKTVSDCKTTVMVGDAPTDYLCATNAGVLKTILVATGQVDKKDLEKVSEYTVNSLSEIEIV